MFSKTQLEYLVRTQSCDDWHCSCFVDVLKEYHQIDLDPYVTEVRLEQVEFDDLIEILSRASNSDIWNLQMSLNFLNMLPCSMFTTVEQEYPEAISCEITTIEGDPTL